MRGIGGWKLYRHENPALAWAVRLLIACTSTLLLACSASAQTLKGVALVIGQSDYVSLSDLPNAEHDADGIERLLEDLGFDATATADRDARRLTRDLEGFVEDAEGSDVAVVYYAGHAVEVGGENYLVPTDAEASSPDALGDKLISLTGFIGDLQRRAKITIVLLDACRNNPFPPGTTVEIGPDQPAAPVTAGGAQSRSVVALTAGDAQDSGGLGVVIAFAAEPGKVALDGAPGSNSPYAAAILRHLSAMAGEEFGTVMRMVAEEVYLKTNGKQRPWINESLHRLLYFGEAPAGPEGVEAEILGERRQLLLTIASLPEAGRRQIEHVAADGGVPMDAVFGILRALGTEAPADPTELDALLREQSQKLSELMSQHTALTGTDPEIVRLASLADEAIGEGALKTAIKLNEQAKARVADLSAKLDDVESEIEKRRMEFARVFAESAAAYELVFDFKAAAADYDRAFDQIERWDDALAWDYRRRSIIARYRHGEYAADQDILRALLSDREAVLRLASRLGSPAAEAEALLQMGNVSNVLGRLRSDAADYRESIASYERAIPLFEAAGDATGVARARNNLATALTSLGGYEGEPRTLERAVALYRELAAEASFEASPRDWMTARLNLAVALARLGERSGDTALAREAMEIDGEIVSRISRDFDPIQWALARFNQAGLMLFVGEREGNPRMLADSVRANEEVLGLWSREAFPIYWASAKNNIANAYQVLGFNLGDDTFLRAAEYEYRDVLEEWRRERVPNDWAMATNNLANVLKKIGDHTDDFARLEEAIRLYGDCLAYWTREEKPLHWASAQNNLGDGLFILGRKRKDAELLRASVAAFDAALEEQTRERVPYDWAVAQNNRGGAMIELGALTGSAETIREGIAAVEAAWAFDKDSGETGYDDYYRKRIAAAEEALRKLGAAR